ncbi:uncharacterized protein LOC113370954 [Ctenocephalides felis]|uniref:uncharacterized protein LOC113370954 n=1 Tax=Ctenocephalides felis TaxID=7515 RepID=UPI000E6E40A6|nr:uncharacterized protein LOC113370954 [Ctenocephalides felis]
MISDMDDSPMIFPRFTTIDWAVCMPSSCSAKDLENELKKVFKGFATNIRVQEQQCSTEIQPNQGEMTPGRIFAYCFFGSIILMTILSTLIDGDYLEEEEHSTFKRLLLAFSLQRNINKVFKPTESKNAVKAVNGLRCFNTICLIFIHKAIALLHQPYSNRTGMAESLGRPWTVIGRTGMYHTDSFLLISGLLNAHALTGDLINKGKIPIANRVISRLFRIIPNLLAIMLFCTYIMPDLDSGPQWNLLIRQHAELCKDNMWKNLLFIQNYMGFNNICLAHTHQLGTDMQLFLATPPLIWAVWKWPKKALLITCIIAILSTVLRYVVTLQNRLAPMTYFGMPNSKFSETSDLSYTLPDHRATPYLAGVVLGYLIRRGYNRLNITKTQIKYCWFIAVVVMLIPMIGPYQIADQHYAYSAQDAALYSAFAPLTFGAFIAWTISATNCGRAGWFGRFLDWRGFKILTNLSYGIYLTQFPVFFYNIGRIRTPEHFTVGALINITELLGIVAASTIMAVLVEYPFLEIRKILFENVTRRKPNHTLVNNNSVISETPLGQVKLCWILAVLIIIIQMLGPYKIASPKYKYSAYDAAFYSAFSPIAVGVFISWIIIASNCGETDWFGKFLDWQGFCTFANISYSIYLTQFPVFFYGIGIIRTPHYFTFESLFVGQYRVPYTYFHMFLSPTNFYFFYQFIA